MDNMFNVLNRYFQHLIQYGYSSDTMYILTLSLIDDYYDDIKENCPELINEINWFIQSQRGNSCMFPITSIC